MATATYIRAVVLDIDANDDLDITPTEQLEKLVEGLQGQEIAVGVAHMHGPALQMAERAGLLEAIGTDHLFATTADAVSWAESLRR